MRSDPAFTAQLLRLANSPFYRRGAEVTSLAVAVQRIGPKELTRLAMASALSGLVRSKGPLQTLRRGLWRRALSGALISEALAHFEGAGEADAFVAGLLHDAGALVVAEALEGAWLESECPEIAGPDADAQARIAIERYHVRAGELLAQKWGLPGLFGAVITTHHDPPATHGPLTRKVMLADAVVELLESRIELEPADLERVGVATAFALPLCGILPKIPPTLAVFEASQKMDGAGLFGPGRTEGALTVEVAGESPWPVRRVQDGAFVALAPRSSPESMLLEVMIEPGSLHVWVLVGRCAREGERWATELVPYGLGPYEARAWRELVARGKGRDAA